MSVGDSTNENTENTRDELSVITVEGQAPHTVVVGPGALGELRKYLGDGVARILIVSAPPLEERARGLADTLTAAGFEADIFVTPDAEASKTSEVAAKIWSRLGDLALSRSDAIIGLGGGATTDLAGFVAATWLRGVAVIQAPTTVLGMVDAAIGGKTGINTAEGKNLVGAFHLPTAVLCDTDMLVTLEKRDLIAGMGEVIKAGFAGDPVILDLVRNDPAAALDPHSAVLRELIERSVAWKAGIVSRDFREGGDREFLNYGHTLAHAIENVEHYTWRHGEAVAVGCVFAAEVARRMGTIDDELVALHRELFACVGLPIRYAGGALWDDILAVMGRDKKVRGRQLRMVLLDGLGMPERGVQPPPDVLAQAFEAIG